MSEYFSTPKYVTVDLFGKVLVGKTTIFELFAGKKFLHEGGNLSYDFRAYYARCWILERRWTHTMIFLADPKLDMRWRDLQLPFLRRLFEPTNVLIIVTDSTLEDVQAVKQSFELYPQIKRKLIIFVIANMQDLPNRLSVNEIKHLLEMDDVLGLVATAPDAREKVELFIEKAVLRYFQMISKRGEAMLLLDEDEIGFGKKIKTKDHSDRKYSDRIRQLKNRLDTKINHPTSNHCK